MQQKTYQTIMQSSQFLADITQKVAAHEKTRRLVQQHLPEDLRKHCQTVVINEDTLIIQTDNATWASRIRFETDTLLTACRRTLPHIQKIQCRITPQAIPSPTVPTEKSNTQSALQLSLHNALQLSQHVMPNDQVNDSWQALLRALMHASSSPLPFMGEADAKASGEG